MVSKPGDILQHLAQLSELGVFRPDLVTVRTLTKTTSRHLLEAMFDETAILASFLLPNITCRSTCCTLRNIPRTARPSGLSTASPRLPYLVLKCTRCSSAENIWRCANIFKAQNIFLLPPCHPQCARCPWHFPRPSGRGTVPAGRWSPGGRPTNLESLDDGEYIIR